MDNAWKRLAQAVLIRAIRDKHKTYDVAHRDHRHPPLYEDVTDFAASDWLHIICALADEPVCRMRTRLTE
jgi:hypothetical protein